MLSDYLKALELIQLSHRRFMELTQVELERRLKEPGLTPTLAILLYHMGTVEHTPRDIEILGCHQNSNLYANLQKLESGGWIEKRKAQHDQRSFLVKVSSKGRELQERMRSVFELQATELAAQGFSDKRLHDFVTAIDSVEEFLRNQTLPPSRRPSILSSIDKAAETASEEMTPTGQLAAA